MIYLFKRLCENIVVPYIPRLTDNKSYSTTCIGYVKRVNREIYISLTELVSAMTDIRIEEKDMPVSEDGSNKIKVFNGSKIVSVTLEKRIDVMEVLNKISDIDENYETVIASIFSNVHTNINKQTLNPNDAVDIGQVDIWKYIECAKSLCLYYRDGIEAMSNNVVASLKDMEDSSEKAMMLVDKYKTICKFAFLAICDIVEGYSSIYVAAHSGNKCNFFNEKKAYIESIIRSLDCEINSIKCNNDIPAEDVSEIKSALNERYVQLNGISEAAENDICVDDITKLLDELRDYYDTYNRKELIVNRLPSNEEAKTAVEGAVERKYKLTIPLFTVYNKSQKFIEEAKHDFVPAIAKIINKYKDFYLLKPDGDDVVLILTLREPIGSINESAVSEKDLGENMYGIPQEKKYRLDSEVAIRMAIKALPSVKAYYVDTFIENLVNQVIEQKLVCRVVISEKHPQASKFPRWIKDPKARMRVVKNNHYMIIINDSIVKEGFLTTKTKEPKVKKK